MASLGEKLPGLAEYVEGMRGSGELEVVFGNSRTTSEGIRVEARWGKPAMGHEQVPMQLLITLTPDASPAVQRRGITTGVLRRVETELAALFDVPREVDAISTEWRNVSRLAEELPASPRADSDAYYAGLLKLHEELQLMTNEPINALLRLLREAGRDGVTKEVINKQLQRAKRKRAVTDGQSTVQAGGARRDRPDASQESRRQVEAPAERQGG